jgi:serine/threonine-protein kinase
MRDEAGLPVQLGDVLAGKYRIERVLGAGAMGVVVAATHMELGELRAIKFMRASLIQDAGAVERFLREARATARLKSRHVAKVHDVGRLETGAPYIVMEHFDGSDLKSLISGRGALPVAEAVHYVREACEAIGEAHAVGIIHRDLKPSNLFLAIEGGARSVKVLDFGVAKLADGAGSDPNAEMTGTAEVLGTPLYMAPEQMRSTRGVDGRADLWSLGVILYRALTGKTPFIGQTTPEVCISVMVDEPLPPSALRADLPIGLDAVVMRCLEKDPGRRFATAGELSEALRPFEAMGDFPAALSGREEITRRSAAEAAALTASETSTARTTTSWSQASASGQGKLPRNRVVLGGAFLVAAVGAAAAAHWLLGSRGTASPASASVTLPTPAAPSAEAAPLANTSPGGAPNPLVEPGPSPSASASASAGAGVGGPLKADPSSSPARPAAPKQPPKPRPAPVEDAFGTSRK